MTTAVRLLLLIAALASPEAHAGRSLALLVGENRGLAGDELLRFAPTDALKVRDALVDVSAFAADDVVVLSGATAERLRDALGRLSQRLGAEPVERLVVYVSSHAGNGALHLAGTTFPLEELVAFVKRAPVAVGVLIVDACRSGAVTRLKGLVPTGPPTTLEAIGIEGRVFISASGVDEYAQESDTLAGSTFTHYLVSGLRGAADTSGDGRVTLEELYGWAWARTIEATFASRGGVQRPNFSVDLRGQGQLVLSEPRHARAQLTIAVQAPGHWLLVGAEKGDVVADLEKPAGPLSLALAPGVYRLRLRTTRAAFERVVTVAEGAPTTITEAELDSTAFVRVASKGGEDAALVLSAGGGIASGLVAGLTVQPGGEVRLRREGYLWGPINEVAGTFSVRSATSSGLSAFTQVELELRGTLGHRFVFEPLSVMVGLELGPLLVFQRHLPDDSARTSLALAADVALEARLAVVGPLALALLGTGGGAVARRPSGIVFVPRATVSLGVACVF